MFDRVKRLALIAGLLAAALQAGCAASSVGAQRPAEEVVLERAQRRWDALLAGDWAAAYRFATPAYRAVVTEQAYGNQFRGPLQWKSAQAKSAKCEEKRCKVFVTVTFVMMAPGLMGQPGRTDVEETWILEDGTWFRHETL